MLVAEAHQYGGTWIFYVIAPVILCGVVASLWLIVKGAIGVFGQAPRGEHLSRIPSTTVSQTKLRAWQQTRTQDLIVSGVNDRGRATSDADRPPGSREQRHLEACGEPPVTK